PPRSVRFCRWGWPRIAAEGVDEPLRVRGQPARLSNTPQQGRDVRSPIQKQSAIPEARGRLRRGLERRAGPPDVPLLLSRQGQQYLDLDDGADAASRFGGGDHPRQQR